MECNGCTLCCKLIAVPWMDSPSGEWCKHCIINVGCKKWDTCPIECKSYECSYRQTEKCSTDLRPDKIKIIFEKVSNDIFFGLNHPDYALTDIAKKQIDSFVKQGFSVVVSNYKEKKPKLFLAKGHIVNEVLNKINIRLKVLYDSSSIYNRSK